MRRCASLYVIALLSTLFSCPLQAADDWTYKVIAVDPSAVNYPLAINDLGEVAFEIRESLAGGPERHSIRLSDGDSTTTLYETQTPDSRFDAFRIGVNNAREVAFYGSIQNGTDVGVFRVRNSGLVRVPTDAYLSVDTDARINNSGQIALKGALNGSGFASDQHGFISEASGSISIVAPVFAPLVPFGFSSRTPTLNNAGDLAIPVYELLGGVIRTRIRIVPRPGTGSFQDYVVESGSRAQIYGVSLNDSKFASVVSGEGNDGTKRVWLVVPSGLADIQSGFTMIAEVKDDVVDIYPETHISDLITVAFSRLHRSGQTQKASISVWNADRGIIQVAEDGEELINGAGPITLIPNGAGGGYVTANGANAKAQLVFRARMNNQDVIIRATPVAGLLPDYPVVPRAEDIIDGGVRFPCLMFLGGCVAGVVGYWDPPVASGYEYTSESPTLRFSSVSIPAPLPGGDSAFTVEFNNTSYPLVAGKRFDFLAFAPSGIESFRITGINLDEAIDPKDPLGFVTGLSFVEGALASDSFTMKAIVQNTDDSDSDGVIDSQDNCPNSANANQADGDADGIGNVCDNCPSVANPTQLDTNGDGVGNACEAKPSVAASVQGVLGNAGWFRSTVQISWVVERADTTDGCQSTSINNDTTGQSLTCTATNVSGTASEVITVKRDVTGPTIALTSPAQGASYPVGTVVSAMYTCTDNVSGIAQCQGSANIGGAIDTTTPGIKSFTVTAMDVAGNATTVQRSYTVSSASDESPPIIQSTLSGTLGTNGWYVSNVTVNWNVNDPESAITSSSGCLSQTIKNDTAVTTITCRAKSSGGTASKSVTIKRDATAPSILVASPLEITYRRGTWVPALFACFDLGSHISTCEAPSPLGTRVDTASVGTKLFKVTATDQAGNSATRHTTYRVN